MNVLLDTHALIWLLRDKAKLGMDSRKVITQARAVYYSPISIVEVNIKSMLGKLHYQGSVPTDARSSAIHELPFTTDCGESIKKFPQLTKHDPFDRMLLAQAQAHNTTLITSDRTLLALDLPYIKNALE